MSLRSAATCLLLATLGLGSAALAQTESQVSDRPETEGSSTNAGLWLVGLLTQADDESSRGSVASFGYGIGRATWLNAFITSSNSPAELANISTQALVIGIDHRFEHIGLNFELEDWGDSGAVESQDFAAEISFFNDWFEFELGFERRNIDISFTAPGPRGRLRTRKVPFDADGWSLGFNVRASDRIRLFYDYRDFDYSRDITLLPRVRDLNLLNSSALTLANSFLSETQTLGIDVMFGPRVLSLTAGEDTSAVDGADLNSFSAALLLPVAPRIDLEISLGRSDSDFFQGSSYAGIGLLIYGG